MAIREQEPDYRFTLANERTFLAYIRTALALDGAGLAVVQFLTSVGTHGGRLLFSLILVLGGLATTLGGFHRWRSVGGAIRRDEPLPTTYVPLVLMILLGVASLGAAIAIILRR